MSAATERGTAGSPDSGGDLEQLVQRFREAWREGQRPSLDDYLPAEASQRLPLLVRLIPIDLEGQLDSGTTVRVETYFERYPELIQDRAAVVSLLRAEYELRQRLQAGTLRTGSAPPPPAAEGASPTRLMRPRRLPCPHCQGPVELADSDVAEVVCPGCGSAFRIDAARRSSPDAAAPPRLGKFELQAVVGCGAFGLVYRARDTELDRLVAVKVPRGGSFALAEDEERFLREARSAARLRHPGIVPIFEVGRADRLPYIVSEFVEGQTLAAALRERGFSHREAAALLAQIADAVEYAHREGVIHRDLKPSNILLAGSRIEEPRDSRSSILAPVPKVTDFGVARRSDGEVTVTLEGQVLGTPAYMSPEQARGDSHLAGPRSDVYSLGVILYEMLTGELPFRGNVRMLLHQVLHEEARAPRRLNDRIPLDLDTICLKCLRKEPGQRYASADALADDLRRFLRGEPIQARRAGGAERLWRWCRRKPALAGLIGALLAVLLSGAAGVTWQWLRAEGQRRQAESNFQMAVDVANQFFHEVIEDDLLDEPAGQQLRRRLVAKALPNFQKFVEQRGNDPTVRAEYALAHFHIAQINDEVVRADPDKVLQDYKEALRLQDQLARDHPERPEYRRTLAQIHERLGSLYREKKRDPAESLKSCEEARAILRALAEEGHDDLEVRRTLAQVHNALGILFDQERKWDAALEQHAEARAIRHRLLKALPDDFRLQRGLATSYNNTGLVHDHQKNAAEAGRWYEDARAVRELLVEERPHSLHARRELALSYFNLGNIYWGLGRRDDARRRYGEALPLWQRLVEEDPDRAICHELQAKTCINLGVLLQEEPGQLASCLRLQQQARAALERLLHRQPAVQKYWVDLALTYRNSSNLLRQTGRLSDALHSEQRGLDIRRKLVEARPKDRSYRQGAAHSLNHVGNLQRELGRLEEAGKAHRDARTRVRELLDEKSDPDLEKDLAWTCNLLGLWHREAGRLPDALRAHAEALPIAAKLAGGPDGKKHQGLLAETHNLLGTVQRLRGDPSAAVQSHEKALEILRRGGRPEGVGHQADLAATWHALGVLRREGGQPDKALVLFEQARPVRERLARDFPEILDYPSDLGTTWFELGRTLVLLKRPTEAAEACRRAVDLQRQAREKGPEVRRYRRLLDEQALYLENLLKKV